jgi:hypothetical protein
VARENCRAVMASVTLDQKRRDSLGSWASVGGRILGATESGVRSMMGIWVSFFLLVSDENARKRTYKFWCQGEIQSLAPIT